MIHAITKPLALLAGAALLLPALLLANPHYEHGGYEQDHERMRQMEEEAARAPDEPIEEERAVVPRAQVPEHAEVIEALRTLNRYEIEMGRLAQERAASPQVRQYGAMLATEHQQLDEELMRIAPQLEARAASPGAVAEEGRAAEGIEEERAVQPEETQAARIQERMDQAMQIHMEVLRELDGVAFDAYFLGIQAGLHAQIVHLLNTVHEAHSGQPLGQVAEQVLPIMERHLEIGLGLARERPRIEG
jgi:predicted outer membrane protein